MKKVLKWLGRNWCLVYCSFFFILVSLTVFAYPTNSLMESALGLKSAGVVCGVTCSMLPFWFVGAFKFGDWLGSKLSLKIRK